MTVPKPNHPAPVHGHRILLTGGSGTLGHHILEQLLERPGTHVLAVHRQDYGYKPMASNVRHEIIDFDNRSQLNALFSEFKPTCVIHCAADGTVFPHVKWFELVRFNVDFTLLLAEAAATQPGCHFIHVSTGLAYRSQGRPLCEEDAIDTYHPYGASKAAADILLRSAAVEFGLSLTVFRPFSFTGRKDSKTRLFPALLRAASEGQVLPLSPGDQVRDFCSAEDMARAILMAVDHVPSHATPEIYNVGSGRALSLRDLINEIVEELEIPVKLHFGAHSYSPFEPMHLVADIGHIRKDLGWAPRHRLAHAISQLAQESFPSLKLKSVVKYAESC